MRKNIIAICTSNITEHFQTTTIRAIIKTARENGFYVEIFNSFDEIVEDTPHNKGERSIFDLINYDKLCGIIVMCERIKDQTICRTIIDEGNKRNIPVISIDQVQEGAYNIEYDYQDSFEQIVRHLVTVHNCKDFYIMGGMRNNIFSDERIGRALKVLDEYGISIDEDHIGYGDFWTVPCEQEMDRFFEKGLKLPDVFVAINDSMALAICDKLSERGIKVPRDVLVTGFDGIEMGRYNVPRLTTAAQDLVQGGIQAVMIIKNALQNKKNLNNHIKIPFQLVYSQSCGCESVKFKFANEMRKLYTEIEAVQLFGRYMDKMSEYMNSEMSLNNILNVTDTYANYMDEYNGYYICLKQDKIKIDSEFYSKVNITPGSKDDDMIMFAIHNKVDYILKPLNTFSHEDQLPNLEEALEHAGSLVFVPMHIQDQVFGYVAFEMDDSVADYYKLSQFTTSFAQSLSNVLSHKEMENAYQELESAKKWIEELYIIDPLTGVLNRRGFYQEFEKKVKSGRYHSMMIYSVDLDGLKYINDTFGHKDGDYAIRTISEALAKSVTDNGMVSRFGGDEFMAVSFDEDDKDAGNKFMYKVNSYLKMQELNNDKPYKISASFGFKCVEIPFSESLDEIISYTDAKMYAMKKKHHEGIYT
jgi:diguanylate cyclase (GGDEF)-like protein